MLPRGTSRLRSRTATCWPNALVTCSMTTADMRSPRVGGRARPGVDFSAARLPKPTHGLCLGNPLDKTYSTQTGEAGDALALQAVIRAAGSGIATDSGISAHGTAGGRWVRTGMGGRGGRAAGGAEVHRLSGPLGEPGGQRGEGAAGAERAAAPE